jgi:hypothetical protein
VRFIILTIQRLAIFGIGALSVWLIIYVFGWVDRGVPSILALSLTYGLAAYVILPYAVRMGLKVLRHEHVPRYTITGDGLPGDPVNLVFIGTFDGLRAAFVLNRPYPTAPFSTLFLFGRGQDIGFQLPIGDSPRKRHHVRFWAKCLSTAETVDAGFWRRADRPADGERALWVGAGTKDTGLSLTRLTFQMTHATDSDTNAERDFIIASLRDAGAIRDETVFEAGDGLTAEKVNHYVTDGEVAVAQLR